MFWRTPREPVRIADASSDDPATAGNATVMPQQFETSRSYPTEDAFHRDCQSHQLLIRLRA